MQALRDTDKALSPKQLIGISVLLLVLLVGGGFAWFTAPAPLPTSDPVFSFANTTVVELTITHRYTTLPPSPAAPPTPSPSPKPGKFPMPSRSPIRSRKTTVTHIPPNAVPEEELRKAGIPTQPGGTKIPIRVRAFFYFDVSSEWIWNMKTKRYELAATVMYSIEASKGTRTSLIRSAYVHIPSDTGRFQDSLPPAFRKEHFDAYPLIKEYPEALEDILRRKILEDLIFEWQYANTQKSGKP
ncbi:hypothetical protein [Armatimonas sp.]|uniref:hypothetical protein n=1 Tax=Armatimonas sp. TaxID=1872638 RepID=UPI0037523B4F